VAIRPVDLQLAYLATPQNAAQAAAAQEAPQAAQQLAAAAFAAHIEQREETVEQSADLQHGQQVRPNRERESGFGRFARHRRPQAPPREAIDVHEGEDAEGDHLIDVSV
jgi:hypothetical protein